MTPPCSMRYLTRGCKRHVPTSTRRRRYIHDEVDSVRLLQSFNHRVLWKDSFPSGSVRERTVCRVAQSMVFVVLVAASGYNIHPPFLQMRAQLFGISKEGGSSP